MDSYLFIPSGLPVRSLPKHNLPYLIKYSMKKICFLLLIPFTLCAQNDRLSLYNNYMQGQVALYRFNGNVLVAQNGNIVYRQSFGFADYNTKRRLDSNSVFDCGSIAKEFTAMGILLLKDKGMISYTDTLGKFFPGLPYTNLTVQQLLTHTSGMPDGFGLVAKYFDHDKIASNDDLVRLLAIGVGVQLAWEAVLLLSGIRPAGWRALVVNSLVETNLGLPYLYLIHRALARRIGEDLRRR